MGRLISNILATCDSLPRSCSKHDLPENRKSKSPIGVIAALCSYSSFDIPSEMGRNQVVKDLAVLVGDEDKPNSHPTVYDLLIRDAAIGPDYFREQGQGVAMGKGEGEGKLFLGGGGESCSR
ncbi:MAG: hypothetical protein JRJ79_05030 [Deltaproteobacteria bacterium]|nr:hypothetical protein [Deltaproteobacteria bacterium]